MSTLTLIHSAWASRSRTPILDSRSLGLILRRKSVELFAASHVMFWLGFAIAWRL